MTGAFVSLGFRNIVTKPVWGDGFVDDGIADLARVSDWSDVTPDELFRFMPNIRVEADGTTPGIILRSLKRFVENATGDHELADEAKSMVGAVVARGGQSFAPYDERGAGLVAFFCGVHPAYLWPEALTSHDRFATYAWLGHAVRTGRALMPLEAASYILDVTSVSRSEVVCIDDELARFVPRQLVQRRLHGAAARRLRGHAVIVDLAGPVLSLTSFWGHRS